MRLSSKKPSASVTRTRPSHSSPGGLAPGRGRDDRAEERLAADADHRGPDVEADLVERLVVRLLDASSNSVLSAASASNAGSPASSRASGMTPGRRGAPGCGTGCRWRCTAGRARRGRRAARRRRRPAPAPKPCHPLQVLLAQALALVLHEVQVGQRHDPPVGLTGRTCSTSSIQREVIQAHGHSGSNQNCAPRGFRGAPPGQALPDMRLLRHARGNPAALTAIPAAA